MMIVHKGDAIWDNEFALLGIDNENGSSVWLEYENGQMTGRAKYVEPIDALLHANSIARDEEAQRSKRGDWSRIGSVPSAIRQKTGLDVAIREHDRKFVQKFFNDPDNSKFKIAKGHV
jgi:hypothetical protein